MLERTSLNKFSRSFADRLFGDFGEWEANAKLLRTGADAPSGAFTVAAPQPRGDRVLEISTEDGEITVSFGMWHEHIGPFLGLSDTDSVEEAMNLIHAVLAEKSVFRVVYRDGQWAGSSREDASSYSPASPTPGEVVSVYSWLGTHDRTVRGR